MSQLTEKERNFLKLWQKLTNDKTKMISMSDKANLMRQQGILLDNAESQGLNVHLLLRNLQEEYVSLVDFDESQKTLNNYAEDILSMAGTKKIDSSEWRTSIDADYFKKLPGFDKLVLAEKLIPTETKSLVKCFEDLPTIPIEIPPMPDIKREKVERSEPVSVVISPKKRPIRDEKPPVRCEKPPFEIERFSIENGRKTSPIDRPSFVFETKRRNTTNENDVKSKKEKRYDDDDIDRDEGFKTGNQELQRRVNQQVYKSAVQQPNLLCHLYGKSNRSLGGVRQNFKIPVAQNDSSTKNSSPKTIETTSIKNCTPNSSNASTSSSTCMLVSDDNMNGLDPELVSIIENEILELKSNVSWDAIAGLTAEKASIKEMVLWPLLRPDLFHGIRAPPKGLLLFGPPGTGKTLIGRCIASQAKATFFNISASSLTSKWVGEGEKLVRTLFEVARRRLPAVIFIDEVDSLLSTRSENEHESSRRIKTEFLQQLDGAKTNAEDRLLLVGATNRPHELDAAARRRFTRRIYIPLPDKSARNEIVTRLLLGQKHNLNSDQIEKVAETTENYSCADVTNLCKEAALAPLRLLDNIEMISLDDVPPISFEHFQKALCVMGPSVSLNDLAVLKGFNENFGYNNRQ